MFKTAEAREAEIDKYKKILTEHQNELFAKAKVTGDIMPTPLDKGTIEALATKIVEDIDNVAKSITVESDPLQIDAEKTAAASYKFTAFAQNHPKRECISGIVTKLSSTPPRFTLSKPTTTEDGIEADLNRIHTELTRIFNAPTVTLKAPEKKAPEAPEIDIDKGEKEPPKVETDDEEATDEDTPSKDEEKPKSNMPGFDQEKPQSNFPDAPRKQAHPLGPFIDALFNLHIRLIGYSKDVAGEAKETARHPIKHPKERAKQTGDVAKETVCKLKP